MDVPSGTVNVAWYALGPHPGDSGSAVIGGHYGNYQANQGPTVFYRLDKLNVGDKVYVVDDKGDTLAFVVRSTKLFNRDADASTVFTSDDGLAHLNLITCEGVWNQVNDSYPDRRVVFTDAIPSEGAVAVQSQVAAPTVVPTPKIVLKVTPKPRPTPTPTETPTPIPTYPPAGGPALTRPDTSVQSEPTETIVLIASAKSLYATLTDGLITSGLILATIFVTFKLARGRRYFR